MVAGVEMGMKLAGIKLTGSGVQAAMDHFASHAVAPAASLQKKAA
jgi:alanine-glyoxylate transaminase/serine-glyoxylate transaminase/serine-pyruvate transaminase